MTRHADLIVVGAGWAGLYAAKYARAAGLEVLILEARTDLGGVWNYSDDPALITVMRNTVSSSSRHVTEASDFSMGEAAGNFFQHDAALQYLKAYAERFDLSDKIVTGARITQARKANDTWTIDTEKGDSFSAERIAICTGVHQKRRPMNGAVSDFSGTLLHAGDIKDVRDIKVGADDHFIVYGGGETASDIVHDLASGTDAKITWAIRGGQHFFRKAPLRHGQGPGEYDRTDMALDEYSSATISLVTSPEEGKPGMRHRCNMATSRSVFSYQGHGVAEWCNDIPWFRQFFNKNGHALDHVWNGRVSPARAIQQCKGDNVVFEDGRSCQATHIICCFGYESDFSFLPEELRRTPTHQLHRLVFHPDDPSLSFLGFVRPTILSLPFMIELQCLYAERVWSGAIKLPDQATRVAEAMADSVALDNVFGYERSNKNITCPFWYVDLMMRVMGEEIDGRRMLAGRFNPLKNWSLFSKAMRMPMSPLFLRIMLGQYGPQELARSDEYLSPMPFRLRRSRKASFVRYFFSYTLMIGLSRLLFLDTLFDRIALKRIVRRGYAINRRPLSYGKK